MIRTVAFILGLAATACLGAPPPLAADLDFFEKKVRPVLVQRCYSCHSAKEGKSKGGLVLDSSEGWVKGGDSGPALVPGDPARSRLVQAIRYDIPDLQMPPKGKLPQNEIDDLVRWVERGAPDPRGAVVPAAEVKPLDPGAAKAYWSYQPIRSTTPPATRDAAWPSSDIDRFVLASLEARGLKPASDAPR